ncbi:hypothetical protein CTI14_52255, partial [Methylobacterium radiotolerans]
MRRPGHSAVRGAVPHAFIAVARAALRGDRGARPTPRRTLVLLTTGTQFDDADAIQPYVVRLAERGVLGLGFGTDVHRPGTPEELIAACADQGIPLFEVPYRTP